MIQPTAAKTWLANWMFLFSVLSCMANVIAIGVPPKDKSAPDFQPLPPIALSVNPQVTEALESDLPTSVKDAKQMWQLLSVERSAQLINGMATNKDRVNALSSRSKLRIDFQKQRPSSRTTGKPSPLKSIREFLRSLCRLKSGLSLRKGRWPN